MATASVSWTSPDQPAASLGELSYRRIAELSRGYACSLDRLGIGFGERVAIVSQNASRVLLALYGSGGFGPRPRADQLPG